MFPRIRELEYSLTKILSKNGFGKVSEKSEQLYAIILYRSKDGLYFEMQWESFHQDQGVMLLFGNRYNFEDNSTLYIIPTLYNDVVEACDGSIDRIRPAVEYSSWDEFAGKLITYVDESLPVVLEKLTPTTLDELDNKSPNLTSPKSRYHRE